MAGLEREKEPPNLRTVNMTAATLTSPGSRGRQKNTTAKQVFKSRFLAELPKPSCDVLNEMCTAFLHQTTHSMATQNRTGAP